MRENIYGPENRVRSARLGSVLYVAQGSNSYADLTYPIYAKRFSDPAGTPRTYVDDLAALNATEFIRDSYYGAEGQLVGGPARINSLAIGSAGSGIYWSDREVFYNGVPFFRPRTPTHPGIALSALSFRKLLGVSPVQVEPQEGDAPPETCVYIYYFLCDRANPSTVRASGIEYIYYMTLAVSKVDEECFRRSHILCCDRYVRTNGTFLLDEEGSTVVDIPLPVLENGTAKGARSAIVSATPLTFSEGAGLSITTVRSVVHRIQASTNAQLYAHLGVERFFARNANAGHCPRYFANMVQGAYAADTVATCDRVYADNYAVGSGFPPFSPHTYDKANAYPWWQEERNYILTVSKREATFTLDTNRLNFALEETGGASFGRQSLYSSGQSRLLATFTETIYVPRA